MGILFDNNPDCILVYRLKNMQLEYANPNAVAIFGTLLFSRKSFSFFEEDSRQTIKSLIDLMKKSGNLDSFETSVQVIKKSGHKQATDLIGKTIFFESDIYLLLYLPNIKNIFPPLQKIQETNSNAAHLETEKSFHQIANEIIEPLRSISTYIQLFERNYGKSLDESGKQFLNFIVLGSQRLKNVIDDIHYYDRMTIPPAVQSETP